jgi:divalent metal cation (Fe/Co/Zn/Cd) transporter
MRVNVILFSVLAAFFGIEIVLYTVWNLLDRGSVEWVGTVAIGLCGVLAAFIAFFLLRQWRSQGGDALPEDRVDANVDDGDPELGHFSPWSWWPILLAGSVFLVFLGLAAGMWIALIGGALAVVSLVGWQFEYYRGYFAR